MFPIQNITLNCVIFQIIPASADESTEMNQNSVGHGANAK